MGRIEDNKIIGKCAYCGAEVIRIRKNAFYSCHDCSKLLKRNKLEGFNRMMKRADFLYGQNVVDEHIASVLDMNVDKLRLFHLVKVY